MADYKRKWVWGSALLVLLLLAVITFSKNLTPVEVRTEPAKRQFLAITVTATSTGTIKSDDEAKITAMRSGRLTKLLFDEGDVVKSGEIIAELDKDEARYNLLRAEAAYNKMKFVLSQLKASLDSFKVEVERNIDKATATMEEAESRRKRYTDLKEKEYISAMDLDTVQKEYSLAKASLDAALASKEQIKAKTEELRAQEAAISEARNQLALAQLNYEYSFVRSPIAGVLTSRPVRVGEGVQNGGLVAAIVSPKSMYVEAFIDEADVAKVKTGQSAHISMDAYPGKIFTGEVYKISPVVLGTKQETRTFEARIRLKEDGAVVKPGMSADTEIIVDSIANALVIPSQAVIEKDGKKFIYLVRGVKAVYSPVETGRFNWNFTEIKAGLAEGETIVITPDTAGLKDGARIRKK